MITYDPVTSTENAESSLIFPFKSFFSLRPLIERLEELASGSKAVSSVYRTIITRLKETPELLRDFSGRAELEPFLAEIEMAMSVLFPISKENRLLESVNLPFNYQSIWANEPFLEVFGIDFERSADTAMSAQEIINRRIRYASMEILSRHYKLVPLFDPNLLIPVNDRITRLVRFFKAQVNIEFVQLDAKNPPDISAEAVQELYSRPFNPKEWISLIKPEAFTFRGFSILTLTEVTTQEYLSLIKQDLMRGDALTSDPGNEKILSRLRGLFGDPNLMFGIAAFNPENDELQRFGSRLWRSLLKRPDIDQTCSLQKNSIYNQVIAAKKPLFIEDLAALEEKSPIESGYLALGVRSLVLAPLLYDGDLIGIIEIASTKPGFFAAVKRPLFGELTPLFALALQRSLDELVNRVHAVINQNCSTLHESVTWRFEETALDLIDASKNGPWEMPDLRFSDVYPLYGAADIRGSSTERANAIQADLTKQLNLFKGLLGQALEQKYIPILDELSFEVDQQLAILSDGVQSGDENAVMNFIHQRLTPGFQLLVSRGMLPDETIQAYRCEIDPEHGIVYERRKHFEESVRTINDEIGQLLDREQETAQKIFPHFFEKYKTDGVEFDIYAGPSLTKKVAFDPVYLQNLRLWQLLTCCKIHSLAKNSFAGLATPFQITQLVLAHFSPLTIVFRTEDKRFDVDGAYNIRYEIIKKRIDKATVKNSTERITQPGKLAIVYAQDIEAEEYSGYIRFLQNKNLLKPEIERLELQELAGASGLKALRVTFI